MPTSIVPGTGKHGTIINPTALAKSTTQNPMTPVEYGRTAAKSKYTTVTSSDPLVPELVFGGVATGTLTGTTSSKGDGTETAKATTSSGSGKGATVTYTVASNVASGLVIAAGGSGYLAGEVLTVTGDTGVKVTIATVS